MLFLQAAQAPVIVKLGEELLTIPKYTMEDIVEWGQGLADQRAEAATAEMDEVKRREFYTFYPPTPPPLEELKRLLRTPPGITDVVTKCLMRAKRSKGGKALPAYGEEEVKELLRTNGVGRLGGLAWILADIDEGSIYEDPAIKAHLDKEKKEDEKEEGTKDPLPKRGSSASRS